MNRYLVIFFGAVATVAFAFVVLVGLPRVQLAGVTAPAGLQPYSAAEREGRALYTSLGCYYCHSQQVRTPSFGSDSARGWGRAASDLSRRSPGRSLPTIQRIERRA